MPATRQDIGRAELQDKLHGQVKNTKTQISLLIYPNQAICEMCRCNPYYAYVFLPIYRHVLSEL
jgi:hypothetical protein